MTMQISPTSRLSFFLLVVFSLPLHHAWALQLPRLNGGIGTLAATRRHVGHYGVTTFSPLNQRGRERCYTGAITTTTTRTPSRPTTLATKTSTSTQLQVFTAPEEGVLEQLSTLDMLDQILDECLRTSARRPIMVQFNPSSKFIWRQWKGTVFAETWKSGARLALWASLVYFIFWRYPKVKDVFSGFNSLWGQLLSVTTFTLTFFVNESYSVWRSSLTRCRMLQGRLNDLVMALAGFAQRVDGRDSGSSEFTPASRNILVVVGRYIRLFNILSYASLTRSHRPLLTPQGMRRMENRGLMTKKERVVLKNLPVPATQRHNAVLMWILRIVIDGRKAGHLDGGFGFEQQMMSKIQEIRAQANSMESVLRGRMPFAYAHIVQVLIDAVLWMYPLMAFSNGMDMSFHLGLFGSMILTSSYQGLFDLAKQFLDPFHNENFWKGEDALVVDTLIAETNAGSMRWMYCLDEMPISYDSIRKGKIEEFILPDEGFSKEDADAANEERERRKKLEREEKKRLALMERDESKTVREVFQEQAIEEIEADLEEFESTKLILEAPPGSDFVPGLDDKNETTSNKATVVASDPDTGNNMMINGKDTLRKLEEIPVETLEVFINSAEEELDDKQKRAKDPYSLGLQSFSNDTAASLGNKLMNYLRDNSILTSHENNHKEEELPKK